MKASGEMIEEPLLQIMTPGQGIKNAMEPKNLGLNFGQSGLMGSSGGMANGAKWWFDWYTQYGD